MSPLFIKKNIRMKSDILKLTAHSQASVPLLSQLEGLSPGSDFSFVLPTSPLCTTWKQQGLHCGSISFSARTHETCTCFFSGFLHKIQKYMSNINYLTAQYVFLCVYVHQVEAAVLQSLSSVLWLPLCLMERPSPHLMTSLLRKST